jgi:hypothetical protein
VWSELARPDVCRSCRYVVRCLIFCASRNCASKERQRRPRCPVSPERATYLSNDIAPLDAAADRLNVLADAALPITLLVQPVGVPPVDVGDPLPADAARLCELEREREERLVVQRLQDVVDGRRMQDGDLKRRVCVGLSARSESICSRRSTGCTLPSFDPIASAPMPELRHSPQTPPPRKLLRQAIQPISRSSTVIRPMSFSPCLASWRTVPEAAATDGANGGERTTTLAE